MADVTGVSAGEGAAAEARLHDFLAAELRQAELDFPHLARRIQSGDRRRRRMPVAGFVLGAAAVVVTLIVLAPRFLPGVGDTGTAVASASAPDPWSSAAATAPSPLSAPSVGTSPTPSADTVGQPGVLVDCGRISPEACATALDLVRAEHEAEVAGATRIVMDDTCPPTRRSSAGTMLTTICDRLYPFDSIVVFATAGGDTTGWYSFGVVGLAYNAPTTVRPWVGDIPSHVLEMLLQSQPAR